ncbi:MAG: hypothetical protein SPI35_08150 [Porphyromonas sp.]|nr:hypothetical protein [Porphyromonas sp.]
MITVHEFATLLGILLAVASIFGWVFKVWIINPLSLAIAALNCSLAKMDDALSKIKDQSAAAQIEIVRLDTSVRSAHNRIDDVIIRLTNIEKDLRDHD